MKIHRLLTGVALLLLCACARLPSTTAPVSENTAVAALVEGAQTDIAAGRLEPAGAALERALRIEPRNPALWHELARVRLRQGAAAQAANLAAKSNTLAGDNKTLRAQNWRLIADAHLQRGDTQGAQQAADKAAHLEQ